MDLRQSLIDAAFTEISKDLDNALLSAASALAHYPFDELSKAMIESIERLKEGKTPEQIEMMIAKSQLWRAAAEYNVAAKRYAEVAIKNMLIQGIDQMKKQP